MWGVHGWHNVGDGEEACWGTHSHRFFANALAGRSCHLDWYEGSWQTIDYNHTDMPGLLGFDDAIESVCKVYSRRLQDAAGGDRLADKARVNRSSSPTVRRARRVLGSEVAYDCTRQGKNILMVYVMRISNSDQHVRSRRDAHLYLCYVCDRFGPNIHNSGAGYNSCRNFEWQMCAALGKLRGQTTRTIVFAAAPATLEVDGTRPLGRCGGFAPAGCQPLGYSNDDIFFLEVCIYSLVCSNRDELFLLRAGQPFTCQLDEAGFWRLHRYLTAVV